MILVDTGPILAVINDRDDHHWECTHVAAKHLMSGPGAGTDRAISTGDEHERAL